MGNCLEMYVFAIWRLSILGWLYLTMMTGVPGAIRHAPFTHLLSH